MGRGSRAAEPSAMQDGRLPAVGEATRRPPGSGRLSIPNVNAAGFEYQYADGAGLRGSCSAAFKAATV